jgi:SAM-dependent methyltransferase
MQISEFRVEEIRNAVRKRYDAVANSHRPQFSYPTGREGLQLLDYEKAFVELLPDAVADSFCGVGNPLRDGNIYPDEVVLDVGCGAGVDLIRAAKLTGPRGKVYGVDVTPTMVERATENIRRMDIANVCADGAAAESLPYQDETFDVVTSNGVLNLSPQKSKCLAEIYRVLRCGGRLYLADMILEGEVSAESGFDLDAWSS